MTLEEYKNILITGTPSDRARAIAEAGNDRSLTDEEFHELTAMIKGVVRPGRRKMTPDEAKIWAEVQRRVEAVTSSVHSSPEMSTVLSRRRI